MTAANYVAYTAPINPSGASPVLTIDQIWRALQHKVIAAEKFVGGVILSTDVISTSTDDHGRAVTVREILFRDGNKRVKETCVEYPMMKVEFRQANGSLIMNVVSEGAEGSAKGDFWMTYAFEWLHPDMNVEQLAEMRVKETAVAKLTVESSIKVIRDMVATGSIQ